MDGVGFTAICQTMGIPVEMPPTLDCGYAECDAGDSVLDAIEHWIAEPCGHAIRHALDNAADAIEVVARIEDAFPHGLRSPLIDAGKTMGAQT